MDYLSKGVSILREDGFLTLLKKGFLFLYNCSIAALLNRHISPLLSYNYVKYNGVSVAEIRDFTVPPWSTSGKNKPNYESGLVSGLEKYVEEGDSVVIVGGGSGVTTVKAAKKVGRSGKVTVYEGAAEEVNKVKKAIEKNDVSNRVDVIHGIVGKEIELRGEAKGATRFSPEKLPECDVLELDCEGSEIEILENILIRPRVILVETHGMYDASSKEVKILLKQISYSVKSKKIAVKRSDFCINNDIYVLAAIQE